MRKALLVLIGLVILNTSSFAHAEEANIYNCIAAIRTEFGLSDEAQGDLNNQSENKRVLRALLLNPLTFSTAVFYVIGNGYMKGRACQKIARMHQEAAVSFQKYKTDWSLEGLDSEQAGEYVYEKSWFFKEFSDLVMAHGGTKGEAYDNVNLFAFQSAEQQRQFLARKYNELRNGQEASSEVRGEVPGASN